ncbi:MAG TPA: dihydroneopterin aldolase [Chitinophagales bacterium]|nr:dihydroneopterin aldolase [Chitinophagales bacterium]
MGLIAVEGMQFYSHHGYHKEEHVLGGKFVVDVYVYVSLAEAADTDQLAKTINYEEIYQLTKTEMEGRARLIEHVCKRILNAIKLRFTNINRIKVRVSKFNPPLKGNVERVYVELEE